MVESTNNTITVSAPSKVLISGGYLIIDPEYEGVVLATSARFRTSVRQTGGTEIRVKSEQFGLNVSYDLAGNGKHNDFIDKLVYFVTLLSPEMTGCEITLQGSNSFYSQRGNTDYFPSQLDKQPEFMVPVNPHAKTGLGSSAALTVSFIACFFHDKEYLHGLCQIANAYVQQKVGSGFDIAAALYGSIKYKRFTQVDAVKEIVTMLDSRVPPTRENLIKVAKATTICPTPV